MALNAYWRLYAQKPGEIKGSVTRKGRDGKIVVRIVSPRDPASGLPTGREFIIARELDKSSPLPYYAGYQ